MGFLIDAATALCGVKLRKASRYNRLRLYPHCRGSVLPSGFRSLAGVLSAVVGGVDSQA